MFPVELTGTRVKLRELTVADSEALVAIAADPRVFAYVGDEQKPTLEMMRTGRQARHAAAQQAERSMYDLGVEVDGALIGVCALLDIRPQTGAAELSYVIDADQWGKGYATEAVLLLLRFGFDKLGLFRIWATTSPENAASQRVLEKAGMTLEGRLRGDKVVRGTRRDSLVYAVLATDR